MSRPISPAALGGLRGELPEWDTVITHGHNLHACDQIIITAAAWLASRLRDEILWSLDSTGARRG